MIYIFSSIIDDGANFMINILDSIDLAKASNPSNFRFDVC